MLSEDNLNFWTTPEWERILMYQCLNRKMPSFPDIGGETAVDLDVFGTKKKFGFLNEDKKEISVTKPEIDYEATEKLPWTTIIDSAKIRMQWIPVPNLTLKGY